MPFLESKILEKAILAVKGNIESFPKMQPSKKATTKEFFTSLKNLANGLNAVCSACTINADSSKIIEAIPSIIENSKSLLQNTIDIQHLAPNPKNHELLKTNVLTFMNSVVALLTAAKVTRKGHSSETIKNLNDTNTKVAANITAIIESIKSYPGSEEALAEMKNSDELESLAEKELMKAASIIEESTKQLLIAAEKTKKKIEDGSPLPEDEINAAIVQAAHAITNATGMLVNYATLSQKELVQQGKEQNATSIYHRDPTWAQGLISASKEVAITVKELVIQANNAVNGKAEEQQLVVAAKNVASSTARLVISSKVKSDPFSDNQIKLTKASKSIAENTNQLVEAAKSVSKVKEISDSTIDWKNLSQTQFKKKETEIKIAILELEKNLTEKRNELSTLMKSRYTKK